MKFIQNNKYKVALTIDLHSWDDPVDITLCNELLISMNIPATFLIPTYMLELEKYRKVMTQIGSWKHELGTHCHRHDNYEIQALKSNQMNLEFLSKSRNCFEDFFGYSPRSFRSPCWVAPSKAAFEKLNELGYQVDSSFTPQRLGIFSSFLTENPYILSKRTPFFVYGRILEVPTSSFLVPLASPSFHTFRRHGSIMFLYLFLFEAQLRNKIIITLQLHAADFCRDSSYPFPPQKLRMRDFLPKKNGGITLRYWLRERDMKKVSKITYSILDVLKESEFKTFSEIYKEYNSL